MSFWVGLTVAVAVHGPASSPEDWRLRAVSIPFLSDGFVGVLGADSFIISSPVGATKNGLTALDISGKILWKSATLDPRQFPSSNLRGSQMLSVDPDLANGVSASDARVISRLLAKWRLSQSPTELSYSGVKGDSMVLFVTEKSLNPKLLTAIPTINAWSASPTGIPELDGGQPFAEILVYLNPRSAQPLPILRVMRRPGLGRVPTDHASLLLWPGEKRVTCIVDGRVAILDRRKFR